MSRLFPILVILLVHYADSQMTSIGKAIEAFSPCSKRYLSMNREIGGPPKLENYWDGSLNLDTWPNISEVRVSLELDNPAKVTVDEDEGRVLYRDKVFHISYFDAPPKLKFAKFVVRGPPRGAFPNVQSLTLNDENICEDPAKWKPAILGFGGNEQESVAEVVIEKQTCGLRKVKHQGLVTNGFPSKEGDWPWHAALYHLTTGHGSTAQTYKCGGSLISSKFVLTAAHCVTDNGRIIISDRVLIQLGKHNIKLSNPNTQDFLANFIKVHDGYDADNFKNDIALIQLATEVAFNNYIQPICLWNTNKKPISDVIGLNGTVIGWGLNERDEYSEILTQGTMPVVSLTTCLESNRDFFGLFLSDTTYCAGFRNGTSVCNGDSGGGMVFDLDGVFYIRGLVSLSTVRPGTDFCNPKHYVIFTDIAQYLGWIENNII